MIIQFPLYFALFAYFLFLLIFAIFIAVNFYHIFSSGVLTVVNFAVTVFILAVTVFTLFATHKYLSNVDWQQTVTIFDSAWVTAAPDSSL